MNSANETLRAIRQHKAILTKHYNETIARVTEHYHEDMEILDNEEQELLKQLKDIPESESSRNPDVKKYRKKPIIVEAYIATEEEYIETLEGTMKANIGDYIITGVKGEKYPCKPDVFNETYDEVK